MAKCSRCGADKTPENCSRMASAPDGYQTHCKACKKAYRQAWEADNAKAHAERTKRWREANRDSHRAYQRDWWSRNLDLMRGKSLRRRGRKAGVHVEHVEPLVVLERDDGVCGICGGDVDPTDFHVDHVTALANGGEHSYANVQTAHPRCNESKGTR